MSRRQRVDSIEAAKAIAAGAAKPILPPAHVALTDADMPFWESVIAEFARAEWTAHQLELAALMARDMADAARLQLQLREQGETITNRFGEIVANPLMASLRMKTTNIMAFRRSLGVHARATQGEARDAGKRKAQAKAIEAGLIGDGDELLAGNTIN